MTQSFFSLDHHLAELRQVGNDLRAARQLSQRDRHAVEPKIQSDRTEARKVNGFSSTSRLAAS